MSQRKIDFVCLGPQRTASSWLQEVLSCHPDICLPRGVKETMFFDQRFRKGLNWYAWHFQHARPNQRIGEIAPTYFDSSFARQRLAELVPQLQLIILLRNPIDRTFSLYRHHLSKGRICCSFDQALKQYPNLVSSGKYSIHAEAWEQCFPQEQILHLWQDDVHSQPTVVFDAVCKFFKIASIRLPEVGTRTINHATAPRFKTLARLFSGTSTLLRSLRMYRIVELAKSMGFKKAFAGGAMVEPMSPAIEAQLAREFEPDIAWLEQRFNLSLSHWRK